MWTAMTPTHGQRRATPEAATLQALIGEVGIGLPGDPGAAAFCSVGDPAGES